MKVSRTWLQTYFSAGGGSASGGEKPPASPDERASRGGLPDAQSIADALTFHAFEIEGIEDVRPTRSNMEDKVLDVKVTPNRGHDCLSYRGIAKEVSAILNLRLVPHPYSITDIKLEPKTEALKVTVENPQLCPRFSAAYITGVKVGASPEWLRTTLESVGQKSINNVVDATNYVMFNIGQPLHAFDAAKLTEKNGARVLSVRSAKEGEKMLGLDDKEYALTPVMLVISDGNTGEAVSIAGIKGGKPTGIDEATTGIVLEAANWDGATIRKTSQALKLRTDASDRFQQVISPELTAYGLRAATDLIVKLAGGEVEGFIDEYPAPQEKRTVTVSLQKINAVLGTKLAESDVSDVFKRLDLPFEQKGDLFTVTPPFERLDLVIPEDLIEEVGRIIGYDKIPAVELSAFPQKPDINSRFFHAELVRQELMIQGYSEVYTSVFADKGEVAVLNKVDSVKPFLRTNLTDGLNEALKKNVQNKDLLGLKEVKLFEIGTVWKDGSEIVMLATAKEKEKASETLLENWAMGGEVAMVAPSFVSTTERYQPFSRYPFIVRDIALWVPADTNAEDVLAVIRKTAGELLVRSEKFDEFKKGEKTSLAFRLVFQSFEKTLTDEEANAVMEKVYAAVKKEGWEVR